MIDKCFHNCSVRRPPRSVSDLGEEHWSVLTRLQSTKTLQCVLAVSDPLSGIKAASLWVSGRKLLDSGVLIIEDDDVVASGAGDASTVLGGR